MDRAGGHVSLQTFLYRSENRTAVSFLAKSQDRQQHGLFERAQGVSHVWLHCRHTGHNVKQFIRGSPRRLVYRCGKCFTSCTSDSDLVADSSYATNIAMTVAHHHRAPSIFTSNMC